MGVQADSPSAEISSRLRAFGIVFPVETFGLHTDRDAYTAGDTIWYKVYTSEAPYGQLPKQRDVVVELVNVRDEVLMRQRVALQDQMAHAQLTLPDSLPSATYRLVVYSPWMLNFSRFRPLERNLLIANAADGFSSVSMDYQRQPDGRHDSIGLRLRLLSFRGKPLINASVNVTASPAGYVRTINRQTDANGIIAVATRVLAGEPMSLDVAWQEQGVSFRRKFYLPAQPRGLRVGLYPEGGHLVEGLTSRVGIEATDAWGRPRSVQLQLFQHSSQGERTRLGSIETDADGLGVVSLSPAPGFRYSLEAGSPADPAEAREVFFMPQPLALGVVLQAGPTPQGVRLYVQGPPDLAEALVVVYQQGELLRVEPLKLTHGAALMRLSKELFRTGVAGITLLSMAGEPLAERMVYVDRGDSTRLSYEINGKVGQPRGPIELKLELRDSANKPVSAQLSVSVTDTSLVPDFGYTAASLRTDLLLQNDLGTTVPQLGAYLTTPSLTSNQRLQRLDKLMMIKGWRRFELERALKIEPLDIRYPKEDGVLHVRGRVTYRDERRVASNEKMEVVILGSVFGKQEIRTDSAGRFEIPLPLFSDTATLQLRMLSKRPFRDYQIKVYDLERDSAQRRPGYSTVRPTLIEETSVDSILTETEPNRIRLFKTGVDEYQLSNIAITAVRNKPKTRAELWAKPYSDARVERYIDFTKVAVNSPNALVNQLRMVGGLIVRGDGVTSLLVSVRGSQSVVWMLDGIVVTSETIITVPADLIDHIDVFKSGTPLSVTSSSSVGLVAIYTRRDFSAPLSGQRTVAQMLVSRIIGLTTPRVFYAPKYDTDVARQSVTADTRQTIYWQPSLQTNASGKANLRWYQSDRAGAFRVSVAGVSETGVPIYRSWLVRVP